ncbi:MAG: hypothetical protein BA861_09115 [Desulfobacterales bacterium S3730MH5]|nr:MAG: hypothetical protein BA861_09115 [Desulfobacterales bacterium S3730MH5]OEU80522.1 MAG: hypothetical protein BA865_05705 [Desulfobacterales bacterium S5133MH4]OEU81761.1 MAG: hypothetical protein BA873_00615 [Desulfobulbaceae bacterium C00003063]
MLIFFIESYDNLITILFVDGGQWNYLGTWGFDEGTSGCVMLSDDANGEVLADAIKWELQQP